MFAKIRAAAFMVALLALAGCATRPPAMPATAGVAVPDTWSLSPAAGTAALPSWWRGFGDPLLVELVEASRGANTDVRTAQANLRQARALRDQAAAALWPTVALSASAQRSRGSGSSVTGNLFDAGFDASWEPDLFGATGHAVAASQAQVGASAAGLASIEVSIAAEVAVSYLQLRGTQVRAAFARENLAAQEQTLQIVQWREQAGLGSSLETSQARSAVEQTRAQLPVFDAGIAQTGHALAVLAGQAPASLGSRLAAAAPLPQPADNLALAIPAQVLRQRPDVLAAEWQLRAAAERVAQAGAQMLPAAQVRASLAWSGITLGSVGSVAAARSLVASIGQTLFDHGARAAQREAQQAAFDAALEGYRASVLGALRDVEDALAAVAAARERVAALDAAERATRDAALLASNRYTGGLIDFQIVLDTQRTLLNVQDNVATARTELATSHVQLYKALGGGWSAAQAPTEGTL